MTRKQRSVWSYFNPLSWAKTALGLMAAIFGPLLRWLGMLSPPSTEGFQNIQKDDVDDAEKDARKAQEAIDLLVREMSPGEVLRAYARADADGRATMDLSALDMEQQDWLLRLQEEELALLGMSTTRGCAESLEKRQVLPSYARPKPEIEPPAVLSTANDIDDEEEWKRRLVAKHFRDLFDAPGVPNLEPKHVPIATLH